MTNKIKIVLVDDEAHLRTLFKTVLNSNNFEVIGEGCNGSEAIQLYSENKPDILLMDIAMPHKTGVEALAEIIKKDEKAHVIMLTSLSDIETVSKCVELGAKNYIRKDTPITEIPKLIKETWEESNNKN